MNVEQFQEIITPLAEAVAGKAVNKALKSALDEQFPAGGGVFRAVEKACLEAIDEGWMCAQGEAGRKFGRVIQPSEATGNLSVDVVDLEDVVGPHHRHPKGEICLVMPQNEDAKFGGNGAGWCVYRAGSAHHPTVTDGRALVLYMLPDGEIEFTGE